MCFVLVAQYASLAFSLRSSLLRACLSARAARLTVTNHLHRVLLLLCVPFISGFVRVCGGIEGLSLGGGLGGVQGGNGG